MQLMHVVGARPNFIKAAPVYAACAKRGFWQTLVHTGQHYDDSMSAVLFKELELPPPDINLQVGSGSHAEQTAGVMVSLEAVLQKARTDWVVVYGDVNSTLAAALVCAKLGVPVAHVEAGLRSFDRRMPEEINRVLTDQLCVMLFTPSQDADANLLREGIGTEKIRFVGNVMVDALVRALPIAENRVWGKAARGYERFALVTLHRPSNVDDPARLAGILESLARISHRLPVIFPVHPRSQRRISALGVDVRTSPALHLVAPLSYLECLNLERRATMVITDSGGIQEETTFLGVPCLTLRDTSERPVTIRLGTNILVGLDYTRLEEEVDTIISGVVKKGSIPPLWDGHAAERIADTLAS